MKKFLKHLTWFLPVPILIIAINYFEDPANIFQNGDYEAGIAQHLVQGNNVTNVFNYNQRLLQKFFIEKMKECPEEIVLGSSRIMLVSSNSADKKRFINNGVNESSLEDDLAIFDLYEKKGCHIQKVIIGLDPGLLNDHHYQEGWKLFKDEYNDIARKIIPGVHKNSSVSNLLEYKKYKELLSFTYFKTSLNYLMRGIDRAYKPTKLVVNDGFTRVTDGSICYDADYRLAPPAEIRKRANDCIAKNPITTLSDFTRLSENYKMIFSNFIEYLQKQNTEVEFLLTPYHPVVYDYFTKNKYYHIVFEAEKYFREFANEHRIKTLGSFDPHKYNLDDSFFYDGLHCNEKAIKIIMEDK